MIDYSLATRSFVKSYFSLEKLSPGEKFLVVTASVGKGDSSTTVTIAAIKKVWQKSLLALAYHHSYYVAAQDNGWVVSKGKGCVQVTNKGLRQIEKIANVEADDNPLDDSSKLFLFSAKQTHAFDKQVRQMLGSAKSDVKIADSYVDGTIFDRFLDEVPGGVSVELMYGNTQDDAFRTRTKRFRQQFPSFMLARNPKLHDRFMVIDGIGFLVGPSLKDAASNSPAILHRLNKADSSALSNFFDNMFKNLSKDQ